MHRSVRTDYYLLAERWIYCGGPDVSRLDSLRNFSINTIVPFVPLALDNATAGQIISTFKSRLNMFLLALVFLERCLDTFASSDISHSSRINLLSLHNSLYYLGLNASGPSPTSCGRACRRGLSHCRMSTCKHRKIRYTMFCDVAR